MESRAIGRGRRRRVLVWAVAILALASSRVGAIEKMKIGDPLPRVTLPRGGDTATTWSSKELSGAVSVIVFWRPRQRLSLNALRDVQGVLDEPDMKGVRCVAVDSVQSDRETVRSALAGEDLSLPVILDPQRRLYGEVGVIVSPTTLIFDAGGVLRFVLASHPRQFVQVIRARLRYLLGQIDEETMNREVAPSVTRIEHALAAAWRMYNLGRKLQTGGKLSEAIDVFEKAVSEYPALVESRCALGFLRLSAGDVAAASTQFQGALTYRPGFPDALLGRAAVLARTGAEADAEKILLGLLGEQRIAVQARYELGRIYRRRGDFERAATLYEDALARLYPELPADGAGRDSGATPAPAARGPAGATSSTDVAGSPSRSTSAEPSAAGPRLSPILPPDGARYVGVKRCKKCHLQQWRSWRETRMAKAFDILAPGQRESQKRARGLDSSKDYRGDESCLRCHTNGFGFDGGYRIPPAGDARAARAAKANAGIGCESCHGPGVYIDLHQEIQQAERQYDPAELFAVGQFEVSARVCVRCHDDRAPCIAPGTRFDFAERKEKGTHTHYSLRFRRE